MDKKITEGNKLIAEFMGGKWEMDSYEFYGYHWELGKQPTPTSSCWWSPEALQYHTSWDWLMPVVEKIENGLEWKYNVEQTNNLYVLNKNNYTVIVHDAGNATYLELESNSKIEAVWLAVVEFIKWYNQNKDK